MTNQVISDLVAELEEMFSREVPCGGVTDVGPCPQSAPAVWFNIHRLRVCGASPASFKCNYCYALWLARVSGPAGWCVCQICGCPFPKSTSYGLL